MNETQSKHTLSVPRKKDMVSQLIDSLCCDTVHHFLEWKLVPNLEKEYPTFHLDGAHNFFLSQKAAGEERDHYELCLKEDADGMVTLRSEEAHLDEYSELRKLYYFVRREVMGSHSNALCEQLADYTKGSKERDFLCRIYSHSATSEDYHTSIKRLFDMCHTNAVIRMFTNLLAQEQGGSMDDAEQERWEIIATSTIRILRETIYEPSKHLFSFKFPAMTARGIDGETGYVRFNSSLHQLAGCRCAFAHELEPEFGYYLTHIDTLTPKEYEKMYDTVNRTCVLILRAVLSGF